MEVTRKNFKEALPLVEKSIKAADFLVIDTEFTGLMNGRNVSMFDTPQEYYLGLLNGCSDFLLLQFGLCAFYWSEEKNHYMNDAYNFYLFPRVGPGPEKMFLCQSSSLDFLASQGFDFNKLFREGITYMTEPIETRLRENLIERQKSYSNDSHITVPEENKQQIEEICQKVRSFLDKKKSDEMEIDRCNAFVRKLLFQELGSRFKNEAFVETKIQENKNRVLKVSRIKSENDTKDLEVQKKEKEWEDLEAAVGFSRVARMISQSNKIVIGHNMVLDLLHTLNHFFQPLPADYSAFKEFAHCMFPRIVDTKYMSSLPPFKDKVNSSVLKHLFSTLAEPPFHMPRVATRKGRGYTSADDKQHEAGYDAYVTGLCFLSMHRHLSSMRGEGERVAADSAVLKPFMNKVYLVKTAHQDSPYMDLVGNEPSPPRDHVFHLTFPKEWQRNDINQLFSPFGPITVQFLDDVTALIALARREQAAVVYKALQKHGKTTLLPYAVYRQKTQSGDKQWRKPEDSSTSSTPESKQLSREPATPNSVTRSPYVPEKVERTPNNVTKSHLPEKVDRTPNNLTKSYIPEKVERTPNSVTGVPEKLERPERRRTQSVTASPVPKVARKRTSSGVFQVDNAEPAAKKSETSRPTVEEPTNGHRKPEEKKKIIERFDEKATTNCVSAFKESDSWD